MKHNLPLNKFSKNIHSQNGEDGIIAEILNRLNLGEEKNLWCVKVLSVIGMVDYLGE